MVRGTTGTESQLRRDRQPCTGLLGPRAGSRSGPLTIVGLVNAAMLRLTPMRPLQRIFDAVKRRLVGFEFVTVVTSFHARGYEDYGRRFIASFEQYWPFNYRLRLYLEGLRLESASPRISSYDLLATLPALAQFRQHHGGSAVRRGRLPGPRYDYRYDAVKFANKAFAIAHAGRSCRTRLLAWLDADTVTLKPVPASWLRDLIGNEAFVAYLGRRWMHSETGFLAFDLGRPNARDFFGAYEALYTSGEIFNLREWHDCEAFDVTRAVFAGQERIRCRNLSQGETMHPFANSPIGEYLDHLKGPDRKRDGRSADIDYSYFRGVLLPPEPRNLDAGRYAYLPWLIGILKPRTIVEVGTWSGHRALQMARAALAASPSVRYLGFDLFEEATPELDAAEKNVKPHYGEMQVDALLARFASNHPGFEYALTAGDTRETLPELSEDFAFIDGGHSLETVRSDLARLGGCKVVVLDDWYEGPIDTSRFGCNRALEGRPHMVLPHGDPVIGGGTTKFAVACEEPLLERLRHALETEPPIRGKQET